MRLSGRQRHVLKHMAHGWDLGESMTRDGHCWLQLGGCGRGGAVEHVSTATVQALYTRQLIVEVSHHFPLRRYALSEAARTLLREGHHAPVSA